MSVRNGISGQAWLILASQGPHFEPASVVVLPSRWCLDHASDLVPYLKPGTTIRLVHAEGKITGANREGWVHTCT